VLMEDGGSVSGEGLIFLSLISLFNITHRQGACDNRAYPRGGFIERLIYPGFGVRVRVVSSCFTDVCNSIILFLFSCNRQ
jgi:hypothetical protein